MMRSAVVLAAVLGGGAPSSALQLKAGAPPAGAPPPQESVSRSGSDVSFLNRERDITQTEPEPLGVELPLRSAAGPADGGLDDASPEEQGTRGRRQLCALFKKMVSVENLRKFPLLLSRTPQKVADPLDMTARSALLWLFCSVACIGMQIVSARVEGVPIASIDKGMILFILILSIVKPDATESKAPTANDARWTVTAHEELRTIVPIAVFLAFASFLYEGAVSLLGGGDVVQCPYAKEAQTAQTALILLAWVLWQTKGLIVYSTSPVTARVLKLLRVGTEDVVAEAPPEGGEGAALVEEGSAEGNLIRILIRVLIYGEGVHRGNNGEAHDPNEPTKFCADKYYGVHQVLDGNGENAILIMYGWVAVVRLGGPAIKFAQVMPRAWEMDPQVAAVCKEEFPATMFARDHMWVPVITSSLWCLLWFLSTIPRTFLCGFESRFSAEGCEYVKKLLWLDVLHRGCCCGEKKPLDEREQEAVESFLTNPKRKPRGVVSKATVLPLICEISIGCAFFEAWAHVTQYYQARGEPTPVFDWVESKLRRAINSCEAAVKKTGKTPEIKPMPKVIKSIGALAADSIGARRLLRGRKVETPSTASSDDFQRELHASVSLLDALTFLQHAILPDGSGVGGTPEVNMTNVPSAEGAPQVSFT